MDDLNSSDIDFGEPDIGPSNINFGKNSIDTMIANASADRIASKRALKHLKYGHGAPNTRAEQKLWVTRFEAFREHALRKDPTVPFTGSEVIRFLDSIINKLKPSASDKPVLNVTTIIRANKIITEHGVFTWSEKDGYHITPHDASQFQTFLDNAVKAGRLIKGSSNLTKVHKMATEETETVIEEKGKYEVRDPGDSYSSPPPSYRGRWVKGQPCVFDGCSAALQFPARSSMRRHLISKHKLSEEEADTALDTKARFESLLIPPGRQSRKRNHSPE